VPGPGRGAAWYNLPMHFGLFVEEMRRGATAVSAFDDAFELADIAEA
jgi:hypothetical protein